MALPPEPLDEVLPKAVWVVEAEVIEVVRTGPKPLPSPDRKGPGAGAHGPEQTLKLKVTRVLKGPALKELVVNKPFAPYQLSVGNKGPFLIDAAKNVLGRYGPDSYALERIERELDTAAAPRPKG